MNIGAFTVVLDDEVERQLVYFWTYACKNERASERLADKLTVRCIDKRTRRSTTLQKLVEAIMGFPPATTSEQPGGFFDFRSLSPREWLEALPRGISPQLDPPVINKKSKVVRVSGKHDVKAIVIDKGVELPGPIYAYDTAAGFNIKMNKHGLASWLFGKSARRHKNSSLYDFRESAFLL